MTIPPYPAVPVVFGDEKTHRRLIAEAANRHNQGKFNCALAVTLTANVATTTITDIRITANSVLSFMPTTAHAAAELATLYVTNPQSGSAVLNHANNGNTDRTFNMGIFG